MKPVSAVSPSTAARTDDGLWRERAGRLFAEFQRPARAMVRRAFRGAFSPEEIDDIYAGAWVSTLRALSARHHELTDEEVRSYVLTAVAHQAGKELRRRRRKPTAPLDLVGAVADPADGPDERLSGAEQSRVARDLLTTLPARRRAVMLLRYGWGLEPQQVCRLVDGLSPRAYRKEITRGVDELTEKMRAFERGEWCADREPVLKAFVAGTADDDQSRQARAHLSHCRACSGFVARLAGHLHDLGSGVAVPLAVGSSELHIDVAERMAALGDRLREGVAGAVTRAPGIEEPTAQVAAAVGARGAGAAGAGVLAKLAAAGAGAKFTLACVGGGVAATACVAAGLSPFSPAQETRSPPRPDPVVSGQAPATPVVALPQPAVPPSVGAPPEDTGRGASTATPESREPPQATDDADPAMPVAAEAPAAEQEFGVAPAATPTPAETAQPAPQASGGGSGAAVRQEFAP